MRGVPRARWVAGAAVLALGLAACGGGGGSSGGTNGTYSAGIVEPKHLTPQNVGETSGAAVVYALFAPLVRYDDQGKVHESEITESITTTDNKVWDIKLKPGFKFHDGTPVTSDSFIKAWNWGAYGPNATDLNSYYTHIQGYKDLNPTEKGAQPKAKELSGLKKISDTEFQVTLDAPFSTFKETLFYPNYFPLPDAFFKDPKKFEEHPIGNGPFMMDGDWVHDQEIKVKAFPDWKGPKPGAEGITFKIYQDLQTMYRDTLAGNLDVDYQGLPPDAMKGEKYKKDFPGRSSDHMSSGVGYIGFPTFDPAYQKVEIRKAISMAIDRDALAKNVFYGGRAPAHSWISPVVPGSRPDVCGEACQYNPTKALELYKAAGGVPGNHITITYNQDGGHKDWIDAACHMIEQALAGAGAKCTGVPKDKFATLLNDLDKAKNEHKSFGPFRMAWIMDYPTMEDYLRPLFATGGSSNYGGYSNPTVDDLINKGDAAKTPEEATKFYQQAEDQIAKDLPYIPVYTYRDQAVWSEKMKTVKIDIFNFIDYFATQVK